MVKLILDFFRPWVKNENGNGIKKTPGQGDPMPEMPETGYPPSRSFET
jgi:hypothetical protein